MIRNIEKLFKYEYQRNDLVKHFFDNLETVSEEEIQSSLLMKWIRDYLCKSKQLNIINNRQNKIIDDFVVFATNEDFSGKIIRWIGVEKFISFAKTELLVNNGDVLFVTATGIWNDTIFSSTIDKRLNNCVFIKNSVFSEYKRFRQQDLQKRYSNFEHILPIIGQNSNSLSKPYSFFTPK